MTTPSSKSKHYTYLINTLLAAASLLVCLVILELVVSSITPGSVYRWEDRLMFFSDGKVFENFEGGFKYTPDGRIIAETYYINTSDRSRLDLEFRYTIHTNNLGLVQMADVSPDKPAIVILGDSFVEGQGASPWFYDLEAGMRDTLAGYQLLNGGILGSSIEQFRNLYNLLRLQVPVRKAIIAFISHDWIRPVLQMQPQTLECLQDWQSCKGDEDFYGMPTDPDDKNRHIRKIADYRLQRPKTLKDRLRSFALVRLVWNATSSIVRGDLMAHNKAAAADIVKSMGKDNTLFIHLPQKDEILTGISPLGIKVREHLREQGYRLVDGFEQCGLGIGDFHPNDGHPTAAGYEKIRVCIESAIRTMI